MRLDDEVVRIVIGLRLGLELFHISAIVEPKWTLSDAMHLFAKRPPADQFGTML